MADDSYCVGDHLQEWRAVGMFSSFQPRESSSLSSTLKVGGMKETVERFELSTLATPLF
jgi:hypothetical protein